MPGAGRLGDKAQGTSDAHGCPGCPHPVVGPAISGSPNVNTNGRPALRVDDQGIHAACCGPNMWQAAQGSATVFINGKPAVRMNDQTRHCGGSGKLIEGSDNVIIGGAPSSSGSSAASSSSGDAASPTTSTGSGGGGATSHSRDHHGATTQKRVQPIVLPPITITASTSSGGPAMSPPPADHAKELSADTLTPCATDDETEFKKKVYKKHCDNASHRRKRSDGVPPSELADVENGHKMRKAAAAACNKLFAEMRAELAQQRAAGDAHALKVNNITLTSGYRDPAYDKMLWDQYYTKYYKETTEHREKLGKHSPASVDYLAQYIGHYKAAPGFSNHTDGNAFDATTTEGGIHYGADHKQNEAWEKTWLRQWLKKNAGRFGFQRLATEAWHWDYHS